MLRDLTMIFSVLVSILSLGFGVYKNVEAGNAKGFAYEQAYRILAVVRDSNISSSQKATIVDAALGEELNEYLGIRFHPSSHFSDLPVFQAFKGG